MQLECNDAVCLKPVLCAVADVATQLQQLQIVTRLLDRAPAIRVKNLVWRLPECPMPPAAQMFYWPSVAQAATEFA